MDEKVPGGDSVVDQSTAEKKPSQRRGFAFGSIHRAVRKTRIVLPRINNPGEGHVVTVENEVPPSSNLPQAPPQK